MSAYVDNATEEKSSVFKYLILNLSDKVSVMLVTQQDAHNSGIL